MKRCPTCGSTYTDDTLVYCLQDGATLQSSGEATNPLSMMATMRDDDSVAGHGETAPADISNLSSAPTVEIPAGALPTALYQESRPTAGATSPASVPPAPPAPQQQNSTGLIFITALLTVLLLGAGGVGAWLFLRGGDDNNSNARRATDVANSNAASADETNTAGAGNSDNSTAPVKAGNARGGQNRADKGGRWFVILGSFPKEEKARANERLDAMRRQGFDARLVESDGYPNMKPGLWVIVMGPYTRNNAEEVLKQVRPSVSDAYTKSGW